jgi:hypothetical protein
MNLKNLSLVLALGFVASEARAASAPLKLPTVNGYAVEMPGLSILPMNLPSVTVSAEISVPSLRPAFYPISAPSIAPLIGPVSLPVKPLPLPLAGRAILPGVPSPLPLPVVIAVAAVHPVSPSEAFNALNETRDSAQGREPIRVTGEKLFDGRRETPREVALPSERFF